MARGALRVGVADTGSGIAAADLPHLFDRLYQSRERVGPAARNEGRGLGLAIVERLAVDLRTIAPELVASPKVSIHRIYRDTRFSDNKTPYKTHLAARFPPRALPKGEGAGV